mgnify:CR=1 FL=1
MISSCISFVNQNGTRNDALEGSRSESDGADDIAGYGNGQMQMADAMAAPVMLTHWTVRFTRPCRGIIGDGIAVQEKMGAGMIRISEWRCVSRLVLHIQVEQHSRWLTESWKR